MLEPGPIPALQPPGRALLRVAGVLTQLTCGACLMIGTIGIVLVQQNKAGSTGFVVAWLAMAMSGLVFGGLIYRGGLISMIVAALIDAGFGVSLLAIQDDTLHALLKILPPGDIASIGRGLDVGGYAMLGIAALCLVALPQGTRYARWFRDAAAAGNAMSTARGFPPPPVPARGSAYIIPADDQPESRRRLYLVLAGLAIGVGTGVGVLVSSTQLGVPKQELVAASPTGRAPDEPAIASPPARLPGPRVEPTVEPILEPATPNAVADRPDAGVAGAEAAAPDAAVAARRIDTVQHLVAAQHAAIARADAAAFAALVVPTGVGIGVGANEIAEGRDAVAAQLAHDLGTAPEAGFTLETRNFALGQDRDHAWIAEELIVSAPGKDPRRFAITELVAAVDGNWQVVAMHWGKPLDDSTAERLSVLNILPAPRAIADRSDGPPELDQAVRAAFASRTGFVDARSERSDAFNFGSGGERAHGGAAIKRLFGKLKAQLQLHDGARVIAGAAWDPAQRAAPWIGFSVQNVDFTARGQAATDVTQRFRVLAIWIKDGADWKMVQSQWSNGAFR